MGQRHEAFKAWLTVAEFHRLDDQLARLLRWLGEARAGRPRHRDQAGSVAASDEFEAAGVLVDGGQGHPERQHLRLRADCCGSSAVVGNSPISRSTTESGARCVEHSLVEGILMKRISRCGAVESSSDVGSKPVVTVRLQAGGAREQRRCYRHQLWARVQLVDGLVEQQVRASSAAGVVPARWRAPVPLRRPFRRVVSPPCLPVLP